jgi:hypothetical protein
MINLAVLAEGQSRMVLTVLSHDFLASQHILAGDTGFFRRGETHFRKFNIGEFVPKFGTICLYPDVLLPQGIYSAQSMD